MGTLPRSGSVPIFAIRHDFSSNFRHYLLSYAVLRDTIIYKKEVHSMKVINVVAVVLLVVGGLNWGLVGLFNFDLVAALLGTMSVLARVVYVVVGISAVYTLMLIKKVMA